MASVEDDLAVTCARQTRILADRSIKECAGESWDLIALPVGRTGAGLVCALVTCAGLGWAWLGLAWLGLHAELFASGGGGGSSSSSNAG